MTAYRAPVQDMRFTLEHVVGLETLTAIERFSHVDSDLIAGIFDEAGRFASEVIAPLSRVGDTVGSVHNGDGTVSTPPATARPTRSSSRPAGQPLVFLRTSEAAVCRGPWREPSRR